MGVQHQAELGDTQLVARRWRRTSAKVSALTKGWGCHSPSTVGLCCVVFVFRGWVGRLRAELGGSLAALWLRGGN